MIFRISSEIREKLDNFWSLKLRTWRKTGSVDSLNFSRFYRFWLKKKRHENDDEISLHFWELPLILTVLIFRVSIDSSSRKTSRKRRWNFVAFWTSASNFDSLNFSRFYRFQLKKKRHENDDEILFASGMKKAMSSPSESRNDQCIGNLCVDKIQSPMYRQSLCR